jgi:hypothetical protein
MLQELDLLKGRLKQLIYQHDNEYRRTGKLLQEAERLIEDQLARLNSFRSTREEIGKKFRKRIPSAIRPELPRTSDGLSCRNGVQTDRVDTNGHSPAAVTLQRAEISNCVNRTLPASD